MIPLGKPIEQILAAGALLLLALGCFLVLWPFLSAILWAGVICFSMWPVYRRCEWAVGGNKSVAAALMTLLVVLVLLAPFAAVATALTDSVGQLLSTADRVLEQGLSTPPNWVVELPLIGRNLAAYLDGLAHNAPAFAAEVKRLVGPATQIAVAGGEVLGAGLLELGLSVFISFFLFLHGRRMASYLRSVGERVAGLRARRLIEVVGATVKGVIYGLIGTALAQGLLAGVCFWIASVPQAVLLAFLTFMMSVLPFGPPLVWGSVALWLLFKGDVGWSIFVAAWGLLFISSIDNVIRPLLLGKTNDLPVLLGLFGLLGGVVAFGFIGIFLGPTLLAVAYSLFVEWNRAEIEERNNPAPPSESG